MKIYIEFRKYLNFVYSIGILLLIREISLQQKKNWQVRFQIILIRLKLNNYSFQALNVIT